MNARTRPGGRRLRSLTIVASLGLAAGSLAACGGDGGGSDKLDKNANVTLTWWTGQADDAETLIEKLAKEFEALHPNVNLEVSSGAPTTDDLLQKLSASFVSDTYPDISYAYGSWAGQLAGSGRALDLTETVKEPALDWESFPQAARETATPDGTVIGFPAIVDDLAVVYNTELFDQAGLDYPNPDWTWDDFRAAAQALNDPENEIYGTATSVSGGEDTTWRLWPQLWQNGGQILNDDQTEAEFNSEAGVDALEFWRAMAVDDETVYLDQTDERMGPLFASGRVGMLITGPWQLYDFVQAGTPYGVVQLPAGESGSHQTVSGPDIWAVFDHDDANRAYWATELMKWFTSPEIDAKWNLAFGNLPLRPVAEDSPAYQKFLDDYPGIQVFVDNLANATTARPTIKQYVELSRYVGMSVSEVLQGKKSAQEGLDEAAEQSDQALSFQ